MHPPNHSKSTSSPRQNTSSIPRRLVAASRRIPIPRLLRRRLPAVLAVVRRRPPLGRRAAGIVGRVRGVAAAGLTAGRRRGSVAAILLSLHVHARNAQLGSLHGARLDEAVDVLLEGFEHVLLARVEFHALREKAVELDELAGGLAKFLEALRFRGATARGRRHGGCVERAAEGAFGGREFSEECRRFQLEVPVVLVQSLVEVLLLGGARRNFFRVWKVVRLRFLQVQDNGIPLFQKHYSFLKPSHILLRRRCRNRICNIGVDTSEIHCRRIQSLQHRRCIHRHCIRHKPIGLLRATQLPPDPLHRLLIHGRHLAGHRPPHRRVHLAEPRVLGLLLRQRLVDRGQERVGFLGHGADLGDLVFQMREPAGLHGAEHVLERLLVCGGGFGRRGGGRLLLGFFSGCRLDRALQRF
mmetsp:Transcript_5167/g.13376  ORF Transcript_5167/g.13376 Transcript_5167/m.13376 type:complete len:412 (+) Transcript_5167:161-1396(+)